MIDVVLCFKITLIVIGDASFVIKKIVLILLGNSSMSKRMVCCQSMFLATHENHEGLLWFLLARASKAFTLHFISIGRCTMF